MIYSVYLTYVILIVFCDTMFVRHIESLSSGKEECKSAPCFKIIFTKISQTPQFIVVFALIMVLFCDIRYANNVYTDKYMRERVTLSFMTRVMGQAEQTEGFVPSDTPVMIIGNPSNNPLIAADNAFYPVMGSWQMPTSITYNIDKYLKNYMGYSNPYASKKNQELISKDDSVKNMPAYPQKGFAQMINGCLVIKISD